MRFAKKSNGWALNREYCGGVGVFKNQVAWGTGAGGAGDNGNSTKKKKKAVTDEKNCGTKTRLTGPDHARGR